MTYAIESWKNLACLYVVDFSSSTEEPKARMVLIWYSTGTAFIIVSIYVTSKGLIFTQESTIHRIGYYIVNTNRGKARTMEGHFVSSSLPMGKAVQAW